MKRIIYILTILAFLSCEKDAQWQHKTVEVQENIVTTQSTAEISITFTPECAKIINSATIEYSTSSNFANPFQAQMILYKGGKASIVLKNLKNEQTYFVRYIFKPEYMQLPNDYVSSFVTHNYSLPLVKTLTATNITTTSATLEGNASKNESYDIQKRGFYYSLLKNSNYKEISCGSGDGYFQTEIQQLRAGATYYYFAFATNSNGTTYGDTLSFNLPIGR